MNPRKINVPVACFAVVINLVLACSLNAVSASVVSSHTHAAAVRELPMAAVIVVKAQKMTQEEKDAFDHR